MRTDECRVLGEDRMKMTNTKLAVPPTQRRCHRYTLSNTGLSEPANHKCSGERVVQEDLCESIFMSLDC